MPAFVPRGFCPGDVGIVFVFVTTLYQRNTLDQGGAPQREHRGALCGFLLGPDSRGSHATCFMRSGAFVERRARIVSIIDRKILAPSALPSRASDARSGCGIKPKTFRSRLQIPAMFSIEPFGFASGTIRPLLSA